MVKRRDIPINVNDNCSPPHIQLNTTIVAKLIRFVYLQHKNLTIFIESLTSNKIVLKPVVPWHPGLLIADRYPCGQQL